jgi:predicted nuclease of restriction endonuclease-like RecB superfamily
LQVPLLAVRRWKGKIEPVYAQYNAEKLKLAELLINTYRNNVGRNKKALLEKLSEIEGLPHSYKLIRGLSSLLLRRCKFETAHGLPLNPKEARRLVFERANPPPTTKTERDRIIQEVASYLGISPETLEENLWADSENELIQTEFNPPAPLALLKEYNLELTRTLLYRSSRLMLFGLSDWKRTLWLIKKTGLMYSAEYTMNGPTLTVEGPFSVSRSPNAYGELFIELFNNLLSLSGWQLNAEISSTNRTTHFCFELNSAKALQLGFARPVENLRPSFDSEVEKRFFYAFNSLHTSWKIAREEEPLIVGGSILLPDFTFEQKGAKVFLEIVGYWTKEYIERKFQKLSKVSGVNMIVAANMGLACSKISEVPNVIFYEKEVPLKPVLDALSKYRVGEPDVSSIDLTKQELGAVVDLEELAKKLGSRSKEVSRKLVEQGYTLLGSKAVLKGVLDKIAEDLSNHPAVSYELAKQACAKYGVNVAETLKALGYKVKWSGLDASTIVIEPPTKT